MGLIDEVVKGVNTGIKQVSDGLNKIQSKSQEMMNTVSTQNRITSVEAKKAVALSNLGKLVYDKYEKGDEVGEDVLKRKTTEIAEYDKEIELLKAELAACKAEHDPDAPKSQKSEHEAGYSRTPGFTCPHCQAPANSDKLFCAFCGGELKGAAESPKDEPAHEGEGS
jgi:hypothetical protein